MVKIEPNEKRIYVQLEPVEEKKVGSLYVPDNHSERSRIGRVIATGDEVTRYVPGDRIFMSFYSGVVTEFPQYGMLGDVHRIVREEEILGKLAEE